MITVRQLWAETTTVLGDRAAARWICETAVGCQGEEFVSALDDPVTERMIAHHDSILERLRAGEPLAYALGRWGFRHLDLAVDRRVLIPRPETEAVAGCAIELARSRHRERGVVTVVDLGTGSGAIGLSAASELPLDGVEVWLTDVDESALEVARANLAGLGQRGRSVRITHGSWFSALPDGLQADVIVSNPPYVAEPGDDPDALVAEPSVVAWEPAGALFAGPRGLDAIELLVSESPAWLAADGWLVLEIGADQGQAVRALLRAAGFDSIEIRPDAAGRDRIALGRRTGSDNVRPEPSPRRRST